MVHTTLIKENLKLHYFATSFPLENDRVELSSFNHFSN